MVYWNLVIFFIFNRSKLVLIILWDPLSIGFGNSLATSMQSAII